MEDFRKGEAPGDMLVVVTKGEPLEPAQNDSASGLAAMHKDLAPMAAQVKGGAAMLLVFSLFRLGSLQGILGLVAATGVLCCSAPGSLGTAYAARRARCTSLCAASFSLFTLLMIGCLYMHALPTLPARMHEQCLVELGAGTPLAGAVEPQILELTLDLDAVKSNLGRDGHGQPPPQEEVPSPPHLLGQDGHGQYHGGEAPHMLGEDGHGQYHGGEAPHKLGQDGHGQYHGPAADESGVQKPSARPIGAEGYEWSAKDLSSAPTATGHPAGWNGDVVLPSADYGTKIADVSKSTTCDHICNHICNHICDPLLFTGEHEHHPLRTQARRRAGGARGGRPRTAVGLPRGPPRARRPDRRERAQARRGRPRPVPRR